MKTCLVVDDSRVIRKVAKQILDELNFVTEEAGDGQEALALCQDAMPNAILLDWNMPVMDGIEFLKALRLEENGEVPVVIFCSTENDLDHITQAMAAGANEYIMKPFDRDIIEHKFSEVGLV